MGALDQGLAAPGAAEKRRKKRRQRRPNEAFLTRRATRPGNDGTPGRNETGPKSRFLLLFDCRLVSTGSGCASGHCPIGHPVSKTKHIFVSGAFDDLASRDLRFLEEAIPRSQTHPRAGLTQTQQYRTPWFLDIMLANRILHAGSQVRVGGGRVRVGGGLKMG